MSEGWIEEPLYSRIKSLMPIPTMDLLVIHEGKLLLMLRNNNPAKDQWFIPGGRILLGETMEQAARRVLQEETGLKPKKITQKGTMTHIWPEIQTITTFYRIDVDNDEININEEHRDHKWTSELRQDLHPYLEEMIHRSRIFEK